MSAACWPSGTTQSAPTWKHRSGRTRRSREIMPARLSEQTLANGANEPVRQHAPPRPALGSTG